MRKYLDAYIVHETKDMSKEQWLEARKSGIGGSDAASVLGLNPYKSSVSVYIEKVDYIHGVSMSEKNINKPFSFSHLYIIKLFCICRKNLNNFNLHNKPPI